MVKRHRFLRSGSAGVGTLFLLLLPSLPHAQSAPTLEQNPAATPNQQAAGPKERRLKEDDEFLRFVKSANRPPTPLPWQTRTSFKTSYIDPVVSVAASDLSRFDTAFAALSSKYHVAVFAEAAPLHAALGKNEQEKLTDALAPEKSPTLSQAVETIAQAFGYQSFRTSENTFLLLKNYRDARDLPFVTYEEAIASFRQIHRVMSTLDPHVVPSKNSNSPMYQLMTALQKNYGENQMASGIPIAALSPERRQLLYRYNLNGFLISKEGGASSCLRFLQASKDPRSQFAHINFLDTKVSLTIYEGPFRRSMTTGEALMTDYAISHGFTMQHGGMNQTRTANGFQINTGVLRGKLPPQQQAVIGQEVTPEAFPDPDAPTPADYISSGEPPTQNIQTLAQLCEKIQRTGYVLTVDPAIAPKTVTLFGADLLPADAVLQNAAYVYGLRVQHKAEKETYLTTPAPAPARSIEEVSEKVELSTPLPWRRALWQGADWEEAALNEADAKAVARGEAQFNTFRKADNYKNSAKVRTGAMYREAARRLRVLIEPKLNASSSKTYPLQNMTEEESRCFTLMGVMEYLPDLKAAIERRGVPTSLANWNASYVRVTNPVLGMSPSHMMYIGTMRQDTFSFDVGFGLHP